MSQSYIKVYSGDLIKMCEKKIEYLENVMNYNIEKFIEQKIEPERRVFFFFKREATTREDVLRLLDVEHRDMFGVTTMRDTLTGSVRFGIKKANNIKGMGQCAKGKGDNFVRLVKSDYLFLEERGV